MIPLNSKRILVIGDVMLDVYIEGDVTRICPEAPVPVLAYKTAKTMVGAAANVARNITALGSDVTLVSMVGSDMQGRDLIRLIGQTPNVVPYIKIADDRITTVKTRYLCHGQQLLRMDREKTDVLNPVFAENMFKIIQDEGKNHDAILISDYAKGFFSGILAEKLAEWISKAKIPVIVDSKAKNYVLYGGATLITPNTIELYHATGISEIEKAAAFLIDKHKIKNVLVTQGAQGMTLMDEHKKTYHLFAESHGVVDVTGAGDTVAAVMAIGLANHCDVKDCIHWANKAAGIVVKKPGIATVTKEELEWLPTLH